MPHAQSSNAMRKVCVLLLLAVAVVLLLCPTGADAYGHKKKKKKGAGVSLAGSYFELLGVTPDCSEAELRKAYRKKARETHPDRIKRKGGDVDVADVEAAFIRVARAYEVLADRVLAKRYLHLLSEGVVEYEDRDWATFDAEHGLGVKTGGGGGSGVSGTDRYRNVYTFNDPYERFRRDFPEEYAEFVAERERSRVIKEYIFWTVVLLCAGLAGGYPLWKDWQRKKAARAAQQLQADEKRVLRECNDELKRAKEEKQVLDAVRRDARKKAYQEHVDNVRASQQQDSSDASSPNIDCEAEKTVGVGTGENTIEFISQQYARAKDLCKDLLVAVNDGTHTDKDVNEALTSILDFEDAASERSVPSIMTFTYSTLTTSTVTDFYDDWRRFSTGSHFEFTLEVGSDEEDEDVAGSPMPKRHNGTKKSARSQRREQARLAAKAALRVRRQHMKSWEELVRSLIRALAMRDPRLHKANAEAKERAARDLEARVERERKLESRRAVIEAEWDLERQRHQEEKERRRREEWEQRYGDSAGGGGGDEGGGGEEEGEGQDEPKPVKVASHKCEPCGKSYGTDAALQQHLGSKKHRQTLKKLKKKK